MNNDNIIEEKVREFEPMKLNLVSDRPMLDYEYAMQKLRTVLIEVEQAGYARAMGEAREKMLRRILPSKYEHLPEHARAGAVFQDCLSTLTPTDNNKATSN